MRLPARLRFPFGYTVTIRQITDTEMRAHSDDEPGEPVSLDGLWDQDTRTIYIRKCLPVRRKRYIFGHELQHAFLDWLHHCLNTGDARP